MNFAVGTGADEGPDRCPTCGMPAPGPAQCSIECMVVVTQIAAAERRLAELAARRGPCKNAACSKCAAERLRR